MPGEELGMKTVLSNTSVDAAPRKVRVGSLRKPRPSRARRAALLGSVGVAACVAAASSLALAQIALPFQSFDFFSKPSTPSAFNTAASLLSIAFAEKRSVCTVLRVEFTTRVRYESHFPLNQGDDLRIALRFLDPDARVRRGDDSEQANIPRQVKDLVDKIELDFEKTTGPELRILFNAPTRYQVSQGAAFTSIDIGIPLAPGADCGPDLRREQGDDAGAEAPSDAATSLELPAATEGAVLTDDSALTPAQREEAARLVSEARDALTAGDNATAIRLLTRATQLPGNARSPEAQELLGLARERNGQLAHAKAEYETYLKRYPDAPGAKRVEQRLAALLTAGRAPVESAGGERGGKSPGTTFEWGGSFSQFYSFDTTRRTIEDEFTGVETETDVNQNELLSTLDVFAAFRNGDTEGEIRFTGSQVADFTDEEDHETAVSEAYVELANTEYELTGRFGRQSRNRKGVFGRFDGGFASWRPIPDVELALAGGLRVDDTEDEPNPNTYFVGGSVEFLDVAPNLDISLFAVGQWAYGLDDRRVIGVETNYFDENASVFGTIEYDLFFESLNRAFVSGSYTFADKSTVSWSADYRNAPSLETRNALQGQTASDLDQLRERYTDDEIYELAKDRTARGVFGSLGFSRPLDDQYQINANASLSYLSDTDASGGVAATESSGPDLYVSTQLIGTSVLMDNDLFSVGAKYAESETSRRYGFDVRTRYPVAEGLRVSPRIGGERRDGLSRDYLEYSAFAQLGFDYALMDDVHLEAEFGGRSTWREEPSGKTQTLDGFTFLGYRVDF